ncbi:quinone oxidoreductase-like isoform X2 [Strongylocentrotus purpuratus]|nr:quinone oxidoreductase-like isoform X2 [Strongylocentrotus purpuratus]XP_030854273.1 quinone oxidoreductase-like isoform X2 [Strongylocentrotus purpuratus]
MSGGRAAASVMRAIRVAKFGASDVMKVESGLAIPEPSSSQVLVKVGAAGVNPVDTYIRSGNRASLPSLPYTPGADAAGTVEGIGPNVKKYKPGDRVYVCKSGPGLPGTYAEYTLVEEKDVFHLPANVDFKQGAALGVPYFTAYRALFQKCHTQPRHTVLIHGASGSVGIAALQFCRQYGVKVLGTAGSAQGLELIKTEGAHQVFNHREEDYIKEIMAATDGKGVDVIVEMLANVNLQKDLEMLAQGGTVAIVGCRGNIEISPRFVMAKESSVVGVMLMSSTQEERENQAAAVHAGIKGGWIKPVVYKNYPLEEAPAAHREVIETKSAQGRIVLVP